MNEATKDKMKEKIGSRIKHSLKMKELSYRKASEITGMSYSYISDICNGKYSPSIKTIYKIASLTGKTLEYFLTGCEELISPVGYSFKGDRNEYYKKAYIAVSMFDAIEKVELETDDYEPYHETPKMDSVIVNDVGMNLMGMSKGDYVSFFKEEINIEDIVNDNIYILKEKNSTLTIVRKIHKVDEATLLIVPMSSLDIYKIRKIKWEDLDYIYKVVSSSKIF